jgi:hypothetical protein
MLFSLSFWLVFSAAMQHQKRAWSAFQADIAAAVQHHCGTKL